MSTLDHKFEFTCPFEYFKHRVRSKNLENHSLLRRNSTYAFIEMNADFLEAGIDSLKKKLLIADAGIEPLSPADKLLFFFLQEYGFEDALKTVQFYREKNSK
jgi:hypothetical protein